MADWFVCLDPNNLLKEDSFMVSLLIHGFSVKLWARIPLVVFLNKSLIRDLPDQVQVVSPPQPTNDHFSRVF
jgi:hypothetical protein